MKLAADWRLEIQIHECCARCEVGSRLEIHIHIIKLISLGLSLNSSSPQSDPPSEPGSTYFSFATILPLEKKQIHISAQTQHSQTQLTKSLMQPLTQPLSFATILPLSSSFVTKIKT